LIASVKHVLMYSLLGNTMQQYAWAIGILLLSILCIILIQRIGFRLIKKAAAKTASSLDDQVIAAAEKRIDPLLYVGAVWLAIQSLSLSGKVNHIASIGISILATVLMVRLVLSILYVFIDHWWQPDDNDSSKKKILNGVFFGLKMIVWGIALIILLDNFGIKITSLVAGLGIGGIAVALASQAFLSDLFGYISIAFDQPFKVGDFIIVNEYMGTVEHIGVKTTRLLSLSGEQIVFCNTDLLKSRIRNYKRMERRRVLFTFGVVYNTTIDQLRLIPDLIKNGIGSIPLATFDRAHFNAFGNSSLDFEVVYYVENQDYTIYMDIQQKINLYIFEEFAKLGLVLAYPTQTILIESSETLSQRAS